MTAVTLQKDIAAEVEKILKDIRLKDINGHETALKAYCQELPKRIQEVTDKEPEDGIDIMSGDGMQDEAPYPYCVVRLDSGKMQNGQGAHEIQTVLVFGVFDDDMQCQGHQVILNMIHRIAERFNKNPILNDRYKLNEDIGISWMLDDENPYPYFYGAMTMTWNAFFVKKEDDRYA